MSQTDFRWPPPGRAFRVADLDHMPDDGRRYELIDGLLIVTPAPSTPHQRVVPRLWLVLSRVVPRGMEALTAPFPVALTGNTVVQPDVFVARSDELTAFELAWPPVLVAEVMSWSTRRVDPGHKRSVYEDAGVTAYWIVDPAVPSLRAWELRDGAYVEVAHVTGDEPFHATVPFPVTVVPARLVDEGLPN